MITLKLGGILDDTIDLDDCDDDFRIYVIRDNDTILYVGKSDRGVINRILDHCGMGEWAWAHSPDDIGSLIINNVPISHNWQVDLFTIEDIDPSLNSRATHKAEVIMINRLHPCLNAQNNLKGARLPDKYKMKIIEERLDKPAESYVIYDFSDAPDHVGLDMGSEDA